MQNFTAIRRTVSESTPMVTLKYSIDHFWPGTYLGANSSGTQTMIPFSCILCSCPGHSSVQLNWKTQTRKLWMHLPLT